MTNSTQMLDILDRACIQAERSCPRARDAFATITQHAFEMATPYVDNKFQSLSIESRDLIASALAREALETCMMELTATALPFSHNHP